MYSSRRKPFRSTTSSFSSFSSENSHVPRYRRSSPIAFRQLIARDLAESNSTNWDPSSSIQRESIRTHEPILPIPRASIHVPRENQLWTTDSRPTPIEQITSLPNPNLRTPISERPFYQILPPPTPPIEYRFIPIPFQQPSPIRRRRQKKYRQERTPGFCATLCSGGLASIAALIYLMIALALPITKLVLGILHVQDCPVENNIPIYMIVSGACGLAIILFLLLSSTCTFCRSSTIARKPSHQFMICTIALARGMQGILAIFLFVWFFVGNYWVFGARTRVQTDRPSDTTTYCQPALYWFAFYVLIFTYVYAIFLCFMKFCARFFCCGACDIWKRAFS